MEIERINENTIKLYISYLDIEDLGFKREEIWYDRERSEQLFWQMIEEVHQKEDDFVFEGPLWIQIQALDNGIEVIVTKSQLSDDENATFSHQEKLEDILGKSFLDQMNNSSEEENDGQSSSIISFKDFEHIIQLSHSFAEELEGIEDVLYHHKDQYYLHLRFDQDIFSDDAYDDFMSHLLEYAEETKKSIHVLREYGKVIFQTEALAKTKTYFPI